MTRELERQLTEMLGRVLKRADFPELGELHRGKVRDSYVRPDGTRVIVTTDRVSAFDRVVGTIPAKGQVLSTLSAWWFERTADAVSNHLVRVADPCACVVEEAEPLSVEMVVRGYLTGSTSTSIWTHYDQGERVYCGHELPDGLRRHEALPAPILTPTTKARDGEHDLPLSGAEMVEQGYISAQDFDVAGRLAMALFERGTQLCAERGVILVDTKYEFGKLKDGRIVVIDEIHTPDSSRFWLAESYEPAMRAGKDPEPIDKEYVRRYLGSVGYRGEGQVPSLPDEVRVEAALRYARAFELLTGSAFVPDTSDPEERLRLNLGLGGG